jgi:primosomal protein N' (replication factor Y)
MFAEVILSKTTPKLDKIYHYKIPAELEKKLTIGHQVLIPFGNRKAVGYVVGFVNQTEVPAPQLKDILGIKTETPLFKPEALKLAKWMTEYYGCFFISALRAVMPPGTAQKEKRKK